MQDYSVTEGVSAAVEVCTVVMEPPSVTFPLTVILLATVEDSAIGAKIYMHAHKYKTRYVPCVGHFSKLYYKSTYNF